MYTLSRPGQTLDRAVELLWRVSPPAAPGPSTWPLGPAALATAIVVWPRSYAWGPADKWLRHLRTGLEAWVTVRTAEIPQPYSGVVIIRLAVDGTERELAVDYSDRQAVNEDCVDRVAVYFKMQYREEGYPWPHVVPGGFIPGGDLLYHALPRLRAKRIRHQYDFDVYGRFGLQFATATRREAIRLLSEQSHFRYEGAPAIVRYSRYLREAAASRVCIDLPGNGDLCFRLVDYLAMGACVVSVRPRNLLHVPLVDGEHVAFARPDLSDLVELCRYYLEHDEEREAMGRRAREYFDRYLHREQLASYYLSRASDTD